MPGWTGHHAGDRKRSRGRLGGKPYSRSSTGSWTPLIPDKHAAKAQDSSGRRLLTVSNWAQAAKNWLTKPAWFLIPGVRNKIVEIRRKRANSSIPSPGYGHLAATMRRPGKSKNHRGHLQEFIAENKDEITPCDNLQFAPQPAKTTLKRSSSSPVPLKNRLTA